MSLDQHAQSLRDTLQKANLVPGSAASLIPADFTPTTELEIAFGERALELGNLFRASECKLAPSIRFNQEAGVPDGTSYTLLLVDPDAPTPDDPKFAFWRHWVLPGLQPLKHADKVVAEGKRALTEYLGPGPKDDSKPHRYLFLLFREPNGFDIPKEAVGGEEFVQRRSFDPATFISTHGLELVGVNWMLGAGDGWKEE